MITDFSRALGQLLDPASRSTFFKALAVTVACYVLLWVIAGFGLSALTDDISTASPEGSMSQGPCPPIRWTCVLRSSWRGCSTACPHR